MKKGKRFICTLLTAGILTAGMGGTALAAEKGTWKQDSSGWQYTYSDGSYAKSQWVKIDGKWYFFRADGYRATGWKKSGGKWYYLDPETGAMVTGWLELGDKYYYFLDSGAMVTGVVEVGDGYLAFDENGALIQGLDGSKAARWQNVNGTWYYFHITGHAAQSEFVNGWWLNKDCTWTYKYRSAWHKNSKGWWYGDESGWYAKNGEYTIDSITYKFDANGYLIEDGINYLQLVNKAHKLPDDWESTVVLKEADNAYGETYKVEQKALKNFLLLREELREEGIYIELDSTTRSVAEQQKLWDDWTIEYGEDYVKKYVAVPGYSEHHTGLAIDICLVKDGKRIDDNDEMIAEREIFSKIHSKLAKYGFILRYLEGKEDITGYGYEPWHFRYIDDPALAQQIMDSGVTLEEYLGE